MIRDMFDAIAECVKLFLTSVQWLSVAIIISAICGAALFTACWYSSRIWNRKFHFTLRHSLVCVTAGLLGFILISLFSAFGFMDQVVRGIVGQWSSLIHQLSDDELPRRVYIEVDRTLLPQDGPPSRSNNYDPKFPAGSQAEASAIISRVTADLVMADLEKEHPFLAWILFGSKREALDGMKLPITQYIASEWSERRKFNYSKAIEISFDFILSALSERVGRTVLLARVLLGIVFFLVQASAFGFIAYSATRDIRVHVESE